MPLRLHKVSLTNFRNHEAVRLDIGAAPQVVLAGANGAGKTNILEAVSLLTPGKGLRGAELDEITRRDPAAGVQLPAQSLWAVAAEVETPRNLMVRIGTGLDRTREEKARRVIRLNGKEVKGQRHLSEHVAAVWLTPQMDRIFIDGASARRKFLDRLVFAYEPDHVTQLNRHEKNLRERLRILTEHRAPDTRWLDTLEQNIAADAASISAARRHLLARLSHHLLQLSARETLFPVPQVALDCKVACLLDTLPALEVEERLQSLLRDARGSDAAAGRSMQGAQRADFTVRYAAKDMPAEYCSTGEQKGLMLSIILGHAMMMKAERGFVPLLLLDEVAAHLDDARRQQLFGHLSALGGQVWLTGTDARLFDHLPDAAVFHMDHATVRRDTRMPTGAPS